MIIGSRASKLALVQSNWIKSQLQGFHPDLEIRIIEIKTEGDANLAASLQELGGKGAFTKELEEAVLDRRCDLAVHSLKDLPTSLPPGLKLACVPSRASTDDLLIFRDPLKDPLDDTEPLGRLAPGATVGTSSIRRKAQLLAARPDLKVIAFRGNIDTRLDKLEGGEAAAILLAAAGLGRLALLDDTHHPVRVDDRFEAIPLTADHWYPAVGQGALGVETRAEDQETQRLLAPLHHADTFAASAAERAFLAALGVGCQAPVGALALAPEGSTIHLRAVVFDPAGSRRIEATASGEISEPERVGEEAARKCLERGAAEFLRG